MDKPIQDNSNVSYQIERKGKYNYKLSKEDEKAILVDYYISNKKDNIQNICNKYDISRQYIYRIINKYKQQGNLQEITEKIITENRQKFTKQVDAIITKALDKINKQLEDGEDISLSQLATLTGILYDKNALEQGKSTSNQAININVKIDN